MLQSKKKEEYGPQYDSHLFEQYKIYVQSAENISDRRQHANNYFITINTVLISLIGLSFKVQVFDNALGIRIVLALIGIIICVVFSYLIKSYRQLNTGKFEVIHKIEEQLPLALYKYEWEILGSGKNKDKYYPFSHIEALIPWMFGIIYISLVLFFVLSFLHII